MASANQITIPHDSTQLASNTNAYEELGPSVDNDGNDGAQQTSYEQLTSSHYILQSSDNTALQYDGEAAATNPNASGRDGIASAAAAAHHTASNQTISNSNCNVNDYTLKTLRRSSTSDSDLVNPNGITHDYLEIVEDRVMMCSDEKSCCVGIKLSVNTNLGGNMSGLSTDCEAHHIHVGNAPGSIYGATLIYDTNMSRTSHVYDLPTDDEDCRYDFPTELSSDIDNTVLAMHTTLLLTRTWKRAKNHQ